MKTYTNFPLSAFFFALITFLSVSCNKKNADVPYEPVITSMADLKVDPSFTFRTNKDVNIRIRMLDNNDFPVEGMRVEVYTDLPENGGSKMICGITDASGIFETDYKIPTFFNKVAVVTSAIGFVNMQTVDVVNGSVQCTLGGKTQVTIVKNADVGGSVSPSNFFPMGTWNSQGVPNYLAPPNDQIDAAMLQDINATLPEYINATVGHPQYFVSSNEPNIVLDQACNVWVTFVHEGAGYKNVLGYYKYNTNNPPATAANIDSIHIIFPNVSFAGSGGGLNSGNRVHLGIFTPGTEIAWVLIANGYVGPNISNGNWILYSDQNFNPEAAANKKQHTIFLNDIGRGKFLLSFEDQRRDGSTDNDFNDAVFYVTADPIQSVVTSNIPLPNYTQTDSDGDGISNAFDDYPNDPAKAFNNFYPSQNVCGTLAFEDLWPQQGDYDMNDIVVDYNFNQVTNGQNKVVQINGKYLLRAMGAGFKNGFGIQLPVPSAAVTSVTGSHLTDNYITNSPNGTEAGQSKATIILFDNGYTVLLHPNDQFVGVNTSPGSIYVTPDTLFVSITLATPVALSVMGTPPYNPFIIVNKTRGREVHLINNPPTDLASSSFFGTQQDNSNPATGRYYTTANNLPWAFDIIEKFDYPYEQKPILNGFLKFVPWCNSSGTTYYDWFQSKPGYRNDQFIYSH
jgi:LruC domain-containing protein